MSHTAWLRSRTPEAPPALVSCIAELIASNTGWETLPRPEAFVAASEVLLRRVLDRNAMHRESALDLLAADACVTYAFEAASDEPHTIVDRAAQAATRIAAVAAEYAADARQAPHAQRA